MLEILVSEIIARLGSFDKCLDNFRNIFQLKIDIENNFSSSVTAQNLFGF